MFAIDYRNDNRIHIFSHGNKNGLEIYTDNGTVKNNITIKNPERFEKLMEYSDSKLWEDFKNGENETPLEVVLHGCESSELARVLSETYPDVYFTGPNEKKYSQRSTEKGPYKLLILGSLFLQGEWETYYDGKLFKAVKAESAPPVDKENGREQPKDVKKYEK